MELCSLSKKRQVSRFTVIPKTDVHLSEARVEKILKTNYLNHQYGKSLQNGSYHLKCYLGITYMSALSFHRSYFEGSLCAAESCTCSSDNKCFRSFTKCECPCTSDLEFNYCRSEFPNSRSVLTAVLLSDQSIINCHYFQLFKEH